MYKPARYGTSLVQVITLKPVKTGLACTVLASWGAEHHGVNVGAEPIGL